MKNWVEIFRGGNQTGSNGQVYDGDHLIDRAVATFNAGEHEPPVVVGHPKDNSPAYGWVEALRKVTKNGVNVLEARLKQLAPAFVEAVREGRYKKRSAEFYKDGRLRHVGFLGGMPPAVKGLAPIKFAADPDVILIEFAENTPADDPPDGKTSEEKDMGFTKEEMDAALAKATAEKDAKIKAAEEKLAASEARFAEAEKARRREKNAAFIDGLIAKGKALPAWKKNLAAFMEGLEGASDGTVKFAEGDGEPQDKTLADAFKALLEAFTAHPLFKDMLAPAQDEKAAEEGGQFAEGADFDGLTSRI